MARRLAELERSIRTPHRPGVAGHGPIGVQRQAAATTLAHRTDRPGQLLVIACDRAVTARTNPCTASDPPTKGPRCTPSSKPNSPASSHVKKRKRLRPDLQQSHRAGSGSCQAASDGCAQGAGSSSEVPDGLEKPTPNLAYVATAGRRAKGCRRTVSLDPPSGWRSRTDRETQPRSAGAKPGVRLAVHGHVSPQRLSRERPAQRRNRWASNPLRATRTRVTAVAVGGPPTASHDRWISSHPRPAVAPF